MPFYKLVASGRPDVIADEIILTQDPETGESKRIGTRLAVELSDEEATTARNSASLVGMTLLQLEEDPDEEMQARAEQQNSSAAVVGADVYGASPVVEPTGDSGAEIDQQQTAEIQPGQSPDHPESL